MKVLYEKENKNALTKLKYVNGRNQLLEMGNNLRVCSIVETVYFAT